MGKGGPGVLSFYKKGKRSVAPIIRVGDVSKLWDSGEAKFVYATIVSITQNHVVLRKKDGKLWCMTRSDYIALRSLAEAN